MGHFDNDFDSKTRRDISETTHSNLLNTTYICCSWQLRCHPECNLDECMPYIWWNQQINSEWDIGWGSELFMRSPKLYPGVQQLAMTIHTLFYFLHYKIKLLTVINTTILAYRLPCLTSSVHVLLNTTDCTMLYDIQQLWRFIDQYCLGHIQGLLYEIIYE